MRNTWAGHAKQIDKNSVRCSHSLHTSWLKMIGFWLRKSQYRKTIMKKKKVVSIVVLMSWNRYQYNVSFHCSSLTFTLNIIQSSVVMILPSQQLQFPSLWYIVDVAKSLPVPRSATWSRATECMARRECWGAACFRVSNLITFTLLAGQEWSVSGVSGGAVAFLRSYLKSVK